MDITYREITKIAREVEKFTVRTLRADGIGSGELDVLHAVRKSPSITQAEICRELGIDKGLVARQTRSLEAKGYVTRRDDPSDGRSRRLYPTEAAERLKTSKAHIEAEFYSWLLEGLDEGEREQFARLLDTLYRRCKEESRGGFKDVTARLKEGETK